ncbi:MAG: hypothetical protein AAB904_02450 [Patescibacteria group bacterium]
MKRKNILALLIFAGALLVAGGFAYWYVFRGEGGIPPGGNPPTGTEVGKRSKEQ